MNSPVEFTPATHTIKYGGLRSVHPNIPGKQDPKTNHRPHPVTPVSLHFPDRSSQLTQSSPSFSIGDRKFSYPPSFTPPSFPLPPSPSGHQDPLPISSSPLGHQGSLPSGPLPSFPIGHQGSLPTDPLHSSPIGHRLPLLHWVRVLCLPLN